MTGSRLSGFFDFGTHDKAVSVFAQNDGLLRLD